MREWGFAVRCKRQVIKIGSGGGGTPGLRRGRIAAGRLAGGRLAAGQLAGGRLAVGRVCLSRAVGSGACGGGDLRFAAGGKLSRLALGAGVCPGCGRWGGGGRLVAVRLVDGRLAGGRLAAGRVCLSRAVWFWGVREWGFCGSRRAASYQDRLWGGGMPGLRTVGRPGAACGGAACGGAACGGAACGRVACGGAAHGGAACLSRVVGPGVREWGIAVRRERQVIKIGSEGAGTPGR